MSARKQPVQGLDLNVAGPSLSSSGWQVDQEPHCSSSPTLMKDQPVTHGIEALFVLSSARWAVNLDLMILAFLLTEATMNKWSESTTYFW